MHTCWYKSSPLWCLLYKPLYKWVKYKDTGGLRALKASPLFLHSACHRGFSRQWNGEEKLCSAEEKCSTWLYNNVVFWVFFVWHEVTKPPRPLSSTLLPHYEQTPFCQALPQAAPCNYSLMPQTGEMGVCYTLHAELRKTRWGHYLSIKPKAKKQNTICHILSPSLWKIVGPKSIVLIYFLFIYLLAFITFPDLWWALTLSLSQQGSDTVPSQQHHFRQGKLFLFFYIYSNQRSG